MGSPYIKTQPPTWFDTRLFYIRITNDLIDDSAPASLKLTHTPLEPHTLIELNGKRRSPLNSAPVSSLLRRDRVDKKAEEVTFVSTDSVRFTGSVRFEVSIDDSVVLRGVLETENRNWRLRCRSEVVGCTSLLKADEFAMPVIEVYTAGCVSGDPVILTQTLQQHRFQKNGYGMEGEEDGELMWFGAGVRVGLGIGVGVCLGVGLLLGTYRTTSRALRRRLL